MVQSFMAVRDRASTATSVIKYFDHYFLFLPFCPGCYKTSYRISLWILVCRITHLLLWVKEPPWNVWYSFIFKIAMSLNMFHKYIYCYNCLVHIMIFSSWGAITPSLFLSLSLSLENILSSNYKLQCIPQILISCIPFMNV